MSTQTNDANEEHLVPITTETLSFSSLHEERNLQGAESAKDPQEQNPSDLAMIVWLRGDEAYADEFVIDAEKAMELLGIKRSRLTQISGRELRVGKIRIDRYLRPMYRMKDIIEYKNWTRATASHSKSSEVIQEAAHKLESHAEVLSGRFELAIQGISSQIQDLLESENQAMMAVHAERLEAGFKYQERLFEDLAKILEHHRNALESLSSNRDKHLNARIDELIESAQSAKVQSDHINQLLIDLHTQNKSNLQTQQQFNRDIAKALSMIIEFQKEESQKQESLKIQLKNLETQMLNLSQTTPAAAPLKNKGRVFSRSRSIKYRSIKPRPNAGE